MQHVVLECEKSDRAETMHEILTKLGYEMNVLVRVNWMREYGAAAVTEETKGRKGCEGGKEGTIGKELTGGKKKE